MPQTTQAPSAEMIFTLYTESNPPFELSVSLFMLLNCTISAWTIISTNSRNVTEGSYLNSLWVFMGLEMSKSTSAGDRILGTDECNLDNLCPCIQMQSRKIPARNAFLCCRSQNHSAFSVAALFTWLSYNLVHIPNSVGRPGCPGTINCCVHKNSQQT